MSVARLCILSLLFVAASAMAFPPAPHHTFYGTVRDDHGTPLGLGGGTIILSGDAGEIVRGVVDPSLGDGINYALRVPMDAGTIAQLYKPTALRPTMPFTIRVVINSVSFVPIEIGGRTWSMGQAGERTRLDLTLGVDSDGDGLPDAWEQDLIDTDGQDGLRQLADVKPDGDADGDGLTNLEEYLAGTYALDRLDGVSIEVLDIQNGMALLRFLAVTGRTYHIRSSENGRTWQDQPFSLESNGQNPVASFRAVDVRTMNVFVAWPQTSRGFFQLFAE